MPSGEVYAQSSGDVVRPAPGRSTGFNPFKPLLKMLGVEPRKRRAPRNNNATETARVSSGTAPRFVETPKDPDAGVILVIGDRMARGLADGLAFTLADKPMVRVEKLTEDNSGIAGAEAPDWAARALARIRGDNVKAVVVMMGWKDLGRVLPGEPPLEFATSDWWAAYQKQAERLVKTVRDERKPLVWVGLAPTSVETTNIDFGRMNEIFAGAAEAERGHFVDIWDIFFSDAGEYSSFGPDVEGKRVRLRASDKVGFTWAGYRKVAFFTERQLSRILGGYGGLAFEGVEDDPNFIVLTGRTTSPETELLGGGEELEKSEAPNDAWRFLVEGTTLRSQPGRVDFTGNLQEAGGS
ncbi:GDSL-type esterase/lipase family protein [Roseibium sp.]|uniref:SGNH/GDSL hydrolase family protein n=1 Tax=Roseibium sp. TaxID=1936156 RepID=UPI003A98687C